MGAIRVITDSAAWLPGGLAGQRGREPMVVPLLVVADGDARSEGAGISSAEIFHALRAGLPVTTAPPTAEDFGEAYRTAEEKGFDGVVSVHVSSLLSDTTQVARRAAERATIPVAVVDSRAAGFPLGYAAIRSLAVAEAGGGLDDVVAEAEAAVGRAGAWFSVDSLEHLHRGGRLSAASTLVGEALGMRPILAFRDGGLEILGRARGVSAARAALVEAAVSHARSIPGPVRLVAHTLQNQVGARDVLAGAVDVLGEQVAETHVGHVPAVIAAHAGPTIVALGVAPAD